MTVFASVLLFAVLFVGKKQLLEKWQGVLFLLLYAGYSVFLIMRG